MSSVLRNAFAPSSGLAFGLRLVLLEDRVELRRFGICIRSVMLDEIEDVFIAAAPTDPRNIRLRVRGQKAIDGHVEAVSLWKFALRERLDLVEPVPVVPQREMSAQGRGRGFMAAA